MANSSGFFKNFMCEIAGLAILALLAPVMFFFNPYAGVIVFCMAVLYAVIFILYYRRMGKRKAKEIAASGFSPILCRLLNELDSPVMIINEANRVVWSNNEFDGLSEVKSKHLSSGMGNLFGGALSFSDLSSAYEGYVDYIPLETDSYNYGVRVFPLELNREKLFGAVLYNRDVELKLQMRLDETSVRVAYIVIDNTNEVSQEMQENRRFGSATVNSLLTEWAASFNAILTEYDRDKYIMQFENRCLETMIESRFDILDRVVESSLDESAVPITISIGVSAGEGTLEDKRRSAHAALLSAFQRGGALAVVRTVDGEDSYGGRTKAVQRQTKIRSRLCRDLLFEQIPKSSNVIIMGHINPDFDSIASNIGIAKLVMTFGSKVHIVVDHDDANISKIFKLIEGFDEYSNIFVDEVYAQEQMTEETLLIITDVSNPAVFASRNIFEAAQKVIVIDHHAIKTSLGDKVLQPMNIDPTASSASELVCEILELSLRPEALRPEEAQILLAGILLDTQFFTRDTGTRTYSACIFLKNAGSDAGKAKGLFRSDFDQFRAVNLIEQRTEIFRNKFAISSYTDNIDPENKVSASKAADNLVCIDGICASFVLYTLENGINLSARSDGSINVINIVKTLGGGGHFQSAGAQIRRKSGSGFGSPVYDLDEAMSLLKEAIDGYIGEND